MYIKEEIDVAIRIAPLKDSSLISRRIGNGRLVLCASREYIKTYGTPKTPNDFKNHNCLAFGNSNWSFKRKTKNRQLRSEGILKLIMEKC